MQFDDQLDGDINHSQVLDFNVNIQTDEKKQVQAIEGGQSNIQSSSSTAPPASYAQGVLMGKSDFKAQVFQVGFKLLAIICYLFLNWCIDDGIVTFVLVILIDSLDFWTVKNVTGRKLVGLRWWAQVLENGSQQWSYETMHPNFMPNDCNSNVFWFSQTLAVLIWGVFAFLKLLSLSFLWFMLCMIGCVLSAINFRGFYKCRGAHQKKAQEYMTTFGIRALQRAF